MVKKPWCEQLTEGEKIMELRPIPFSNFVYGEQIFFVEVGSGGRIIGSAEFQGRVRIRNKEWFQRWYPKHRCIDMPDYRKLYGLYFATPKRLTDPIFTKRSGLGHSQTHGSLEPDDVKMKGVIPDQVHFVTPVTYFQNSTQDNSLVAAPLVPNDGEDVFIAPDGTAFAAHSSITWRRYQRKGETPIKWDPALKADYPSWWVPTAPEKPGPNCIDASIGWNVMRVDNQLMCMMERHQEWLDQHTHTMQSIIFILFLPSCAIAHVCPFPAFQLAHAAATVL
jgi:hypothetical protein